MVDGDKPLPTAGVAAPAVAYFQALRATRAEAARSHQEGADRMTDLAAYRAARRGGRGNPR